MTTMWLASAAWLADISMIAASQLPDDAEIMFRRYRGDDEVTDHDRGRGRGRNGDRPEDRSGSNSGQGAGKSGGHSAGKSGKSGRGSGDTDDRFGK